MDMTRPSGHDQAEDPIKVHHPEEEELHETGASKMYRRVKARAKKFKNSLTKHGNEDEQVDEEDDESDDQGPEVQGVTGQADQSLSQGRETNAPPGAKVSPVASSFDYTKPVEPETLRDTSYGHEASSPPVREAPSVPLRVSDLSDREEIREAHHEPLNTPLSLLSETEDVKTGTFAPGEDDYLGGQQKVSTEGSDYLSGVSNNESKVTDPTKEGCGEAGVAEIGESLGKMQVSDDRKSGTGFDSDLPTRSHEYSSSGFEEETGTELRDDFLEKGNEFDQEIESGIRKDSLAGFEGTELRDNEYDGPGRLETELGTDLSMETHDPSSPELSRPRQKDGDFDEPKPNTYKEMMGTVATDKALVTEKKLAPVDEKFKETGATETAKLPLSRDGDGDGSGVEEDKAVLPSEKRIPGQEDKALWESLKEERKQGESAAEEGMVGKIRGAVTSWFGGAAEEGNPKSPDSVKESSQPLGTTGVSDPGESGLGVKTDDTGPVPAQKEL